MSRAKRFKEKRGLNRELTAKEKKIARLQGRAQKLDDYSNRAFARSLVQQFGTRGELSGLQWEWVDKLLRMPATNRKSRQAAHGQFYVYLATAGDFAKIGYSDCPQKRIQGIQTGCPHFVQLAAVEQFATDQDARRREKYLHHKFKNHRAHGEWFKSDIVEECQLIMRGVLK